MNNINDNESNMSFNVTDQGSIATIKKDLTSSLSSFLDLEASELFHQLEQPFKEGHGHLALPIFPYSKAKKQNPMVFAQDLAKKIQEQNLDFLEKVEPISGFINFYFKKSYLKSHLEKFIAQKDLISFKKDKEEHWVVDFASPNVAKYMNIGHLRATVIGQAIVNLIKQFDYKVTTLNHLGDWGSQFGKLLWAYQTWHKEYDFKNNPFETLVSLYVRFHKEAESDSTKLKEATDLFQRLEQGDPELEKLWKMFVQLSLKNYDQYWKTLNVKHDLVLGESFYRNQIDDLKKRLNQKKLLKKSEGAEVVFLEEDSPPCLIVKSDGASTYGARDLCSAIYRFEKLKASKNIYITGSDQKLHFKQIFQTLNKMDFPWSKSCSHLSFGMYRFKGEGKMSTRKGQAIYLKDVIDEAVKRVSQIIEERRPDLKDKEEVCKKVGIGAIVFNDLMNDSIKDVDFNWDKVLDFEGRSGPFVQYTYVRCLSLLKKANNKTNKTFSKKDLTDEEIQLIWLLLSFEEAVLQSFKHFKPHLLARYLLDLSKAFNRFYASEKILDSERKEDLILLVDTVRRTLLKGLNILNVPAPTAM